MSKDQAIYLGIDLGTSRSAISSSNGERHTTESYVGWPLDMVARKVLKKSVLIGREALENRTMVDLHRPLERGLIKEGSEKDVLAVRELLRHLVRMAVGEPVEDADPKKAKTPKVRAVVGVPAEALRTNKQNLRAAMEDIVDDLMIVSEPFAVAYGLDALVHTMIIDIGAGTADLCVMSGHYPTEEEQRTLTTAGDSIDEQLLKLVGERFPHASVTIHMVRRWKEESSFVGKSKKAVKVTVPVEGKPTEIDISDEMKAACESLVGPVSEMMLDLLARSEPEYQEKIRQNIILTGGTALIPGLGDALEAALIEYGGGKVTVVEDPTFVGSNGGLALATEAPSSEWEKLAG